MNMGHVIEARDNIEKIRSHGKASPDGNVLVGCHVTAGLAARALEKATVNIALGADGPLEEFLLIALSRATITK